MRPVGGGFQSGTLLRSSGFRRIAFANGHTSASWAQ